MQITKELLKDWGACRDGFAWFMSKFPQGAEYAEVNRALREEKRYPDSSWLTNHVYASLLDKPELIGSLVESEVNQAIEETKDSPNSATGDSSKAASSGNSSTAASSGNSSTAASSGYSSKAASSGYSSKAASSGDYSTAASSGNSSTAASSGNSSKAASSGNSSKAEAKGVLTVAMVAGVNGRARAGEQGAFALAWKDGEQMRIAVGVVGENGIKANTWYAVSKTGELEEVIG